MKAYALLRLKVETIWRSDENWPRNQMMASEIISMSKLLWQVIASNSNIQSGVNSK